MILDVRTSYVMGAGFVAIAGAYLLVLAYRLPAELRPSARAWGLGGLTMALSWSLFALDEVLPDLATVLFANLAYLVAATLLYASVRLFDGLEPRRDVYLKVVLPAMALTLAARYGIDAYELRVGVMSAAPALLLALAARHLLVRRPDGLPGGFGRRTTAFWLLGNAGILVARAGAALAPGAAPPMFANGAQQTLTLAVALLSVVGLIFSYFLLYTGRVTTELQRQADRDPLTGLYNRRAFELQAEREIGLAAARQRPLAVLLMDADAFKPVNDAWGHDAGDQALRAIAEALRANLRTQDVLARLGGDEFAVLLPGVGEEQARLLAQRLRGGVAGAPFPYPAELGISVGLAMLEPGGSDLRGLLLRADEDLYAEKRRRKGAGAAR